LGGPFGVADEYTGRLEEMSSKCASGPLSLERGDWKAQTSLLVAARLQNLGGGKMGKA
jgi:hypothetical protein